MAKFLRIKSASIWQC